MDKNLTNKKSVSAVLYRYFWLLIIGSFFGWLIETIYWIIYSGHFESRKGMIYGPFIVIYGLAAVLLDLIFGKLKKKKWYTIFVIGFFFGMIFEYFCSIFQEYVLGSTSWDYSYSKFSINGRVDLIFSLLWGLCALFFTYVLLPLIDRSMKYLLTKPGKVIIIMLMIFYVFSATISFFAVNRQSERLNNIPPKNQFDSFLDETYPDEFLKEIFPNMKFKNEN